MKQAYLVFMATKRLMSEITKRGSTRSSEKRGADVRVDIQVAGAHGHARALDDAGPFAGQKIGPRHAALAKQVWVGPSSRYATATQAHKTRRQSKSADETA